MRHEIKFSAVEQDADAVVGEVAESTGAGFGGLDAAVEAFGGRVADPVTEPCQDAGKSVFQHPRHFLHGLQTAA